MNILITGVHGFVGSNLVDYLKGDNQIFGLDIVAPQRNGVVRTFSWEEMDAGRLPKVEVVIHLAGKAHDTKNKAASDVYFSVNTGLTQRIYDYFLSSEAKKFIFFSTAKAAADKVDGILTEDVIPVPVGPYGESKIKAENYIFSKQLQKGKSVYVLRPCMIHGPGNKGNLNLLFSVISRGYPWPLGAYDNYRTFASVENVCFVVKGLITCDIESGIYNVGDDEPLSTNELIGIICHTLGLKCRIWKVPKWMVIFCARIGGWLHLPLNPDRLRKLTENYVASNEKIKKSLGVNQMPVTSRDGLIRTIESFRK